MGRQSSSNMHKVAWAESYLHIKWHLNSFNRLATTYMGPKLGAVPPFGRGSWVPI